MENKSLIKKLFEEIRLNLIRSRSSIKKIVAGLLVASTLTLASCQTVPPIIDDTTQNDINNDNGINSDNQNNNNNSDNNNNENPNNNTSNSEDENPFSKYSELLQNVLTDDYYKGLIAQALRSNSFLKTAYFDPHPYIFLEDEGFDVEKIKKGEIECVSTSYLHNNDFYIQTKVAIDSNAQNYKYYNLKYSLTEKEVKDLKFLFTQEFCQTPLFIQEIDNVKEPEIVGEACISKTAQEELDTYIKYQTIIKDNLKPHTNYALIYETFLLGNYGTSGYDTDTFEILVYPKMTNDKIKGKDFKLGTVTITMRIKDKLDKDVPFTSASSSYFMLEEENVQNFINSVSTVTFYNCQDIALDEDLTKTHMNYSK